LVVLVALRACVQIVEQLGQVLIV